METNEDIFKGLGIEISLKNEDDFLKIRETLTRIGVASTREKKLWQSCHILHKKGRYSIMHFKEMFILDGKYNTFSEEDENRRSVIAKLLEEWGLVEILEKEKLEGCDKTKLSKMKIIPFKEKKDWVLCNKYNIGNRESF